MITMLDAFDHQTTSNLYYPLKLWAINELNTATHHHALAAYYDIYSPVACYSAIRLREVIGNKYQPVLAETLIYNGGDCIPAHKDRKGLEYAAIWPVYARGKPPSDFEIENQLYPQKENEILFFEGCKHKHRRSYYSGDGMVVLVLFYSKHCGVNLWNGYDKGKKILEKYDATQTQH